MNSDSFELILVPSPNDAPPFSEEYQQELSEFTKNAGASSQTMFAMDSGSGGGGALGEFVFNNSSALIATLSTLGGVWLKSKFGRKLKLRFGDIEIEANSIEEINSMVEAVLTLKGKAKSKK